MNTDQLSRLIIDILNEHKGFDITEIDIRSLTHMANCMIICSGTSKRHLHALADKIVSQMKDRKIKPLGVEGNTDAEWVLVDMGDIIVHLMLTETRAFYDLEKLWYVSKFDRDIPVDVH